MWLTGVCSKIIVFANHNEPILQRKLKRRTNIFRFNISVISKYLCFGHAPAKHFKDVLYTDAHPANARASTTLLRVKGNTICIVHDHKLTSNAPKSKIESY